MINMNIKRNFKDLEIYMCVMSAYSIADMDYEFSIKGNNLPMVQIGKISAYCDGSELLLDDFKNTIGSEIYVPLDYGRVCQGEDDVYPSYTEIFEVGVHHGMYDITEDKYKILNYDKDEIISVLFDMAKECQKMYIKSLDITQDHVISASKMLKGKEGTYAIRYYEGDNNNNLVFGDMYGFGLCEINIEKDMSIKDIASLIGKSLELELNLDDTDEEYGEDDLDHSLVKCCGTCTEYHINKKDGYSHCTHFGVPMDMFNVACRCYNAYPTTGKDRIEEILDVEEFTI